jgi:hypothetical protein
MATMTGSRVKVLGFPFMGRAVASAALALTLCGPAVAKEENCEAASPPKEAGFIPVAHTGLAIYPRMKDVRRNYSGCQIWWEPDLKTEWKRMLVARFDVGGLAEVRVLLGGGQPDVYCRYKAGRLVSGKDGKCVSSEAEYRDLAKSISWACAQNEYGTDKYSEGKCPRE